MKAQNKSCEFVFLGHGFKTASAILVGFGGVGKDMGVEYPIQFIYAINKTNLHIGHFVMHSN